MNPKKADRNHLATLTDLPNVGQSTVEDLHAIGINKPSDLEGQDPYQLYDKLCRSAGKPQDPRILDIFISITRFLAGDEAQPWWAYSAERKATLNLQTPPTQPSEHTPTIGEQADDAGGVEGSNPDADATKNGLIDYIELPCRHLGQTEEFFRNVFDWQFSAYGESYTAFSGSGIEGGFYLSQCVNHSANGGALIVIYDANLPACQARIVDAGGYINRPIFDFPGGQRFHFLDPNGNEWGVWSDRLS